MLCKISRTCTCCRCGHEAGKGSRESIRKFYANEIIVVWITVRISTRIQKLFLLNNETFPWYLCKSSWMVRSRIRLLYPLLFSSSRRFEWAIWMYSLSARLVIILFMKSDWVFRTQNNFQIMFNIHKMLNIYWPGNEGAIKTALMS